MAGSISAVRGAVFLFIMSPTNCMMASSGSIHSLMSQWVCKAQNGNQEHSKAAIQGIECCYVDCSIKAVVHVNTSCMEVHSGKELRANMQAGVTISEPSYVP